MSKKEKFARRRAFLRVANRSNHSLHHHVAVVLSHGTILTIKSNWDWRHAEHRAILAVPKHKRAGCLIISLRYGRDGGLMLAKPCASCAALIKQEGMKRVVYSDANGDIVSEAVV